jgi:alkylhydroperoxidase/carboxymuconolactone decarboxylase family protein YurZ
MPASLGGLRRIPPHPCGVARHAAMRANVGARETVNVRAREPRDPENRAPPVAAAATATERKRNMSTPVNVDVDPATRDALSGLSLGDVEVLGEVLELREGLQVNSGLDARTFALVKIAALVAVDAPPASYLWQVSNALDAGASPAEILGVLRAVAPQVGGPRVVAAAPEIMVALGLSLPAGQDI